MMVSPLAKSVSAKTPLPCTPERLRTSPASGIHTPFGTSSCRECAVGRCERHLLHGGGCSVGACRVDQREDCEPRVAHRARDASVGSRVAGRCESHTPLGAEPCPPRARMAGAGGTALDLASNNLIVGDMLGSAGRIEFRDMRIYNVRRLSRVSAAAHVPHGRCGLFVCVQGYAVRRPRSHAGRCRMWATGCVASQCVVCHLAFAEFRLPPVKACMFCVTLHGAWCPGYTYPRRPAIHRMLHVVHAR